MFRTFRIALAAVCVLQLPIHAPGQTPAPRAVVVEGALIVIAVSESGKTIYGYSEATGEWEGISVENPGKSRLNPVVGSATAFVAIDTKIHAFSAATGRWDTINLPGHAQPHMMGGRIRVDLGKKIHMFTGKTGTWSTVDLGEDN